MSEPGIRLLAPDDLDNALALSSSAGWNQQLDDWRLMLALAPHGSFAAVSDGRLVGTAMAIDYQGFAWIAMMLVDPAFRGRGLGRRLLEATIDSVPADRPVRLDATPLGRPLYRSYGFEEEAMLTRLVRDVSTHATNAGAGAGDTGSGASPAGPDARLPAVRPLTAADLPGIIARDRQVFGGDRAAVLSRVRDWAPQYARIVEDAAGPAPYCLGRQGRLFDHIGPVISVGDDAARALVSAAIVGAEGRAVALDVFDCHITFAAWLRTRGFRFERPLFRMRRPPDRSSGVIDDRSGSALPPQGAQNARRGPRLVELAILGPEFG